MQKKCECYWPELISDTFEPGQGITVVLNSITPFTDYTVRKMTVTQIRTSGVINLHFEYSVYYYYNCFSDV